ncbi:MAG: efflux RND transporter permease subunit [Alphaproteobacteria bacterium]|nr:efflux RND transporter permease subunit [Alphaproteobacteria bacterium]
MIKFFVQRPVTTIMFVLLWVVLGIVAFPKMNVERIPPIDLPMVTATLVYPGASPAEIETQVVQKAEDAMSEVAGIKRIQSQAFENGGFVMAEFNIGVNVNDKAAEVKAKLDAISNEFPEGLKQPVVEKLNPLQQSVVDIVLTGTNPRDLEFYVNDALANKITAVKGVASVSLFGGESRAVRIFMNPELMAARGVAVMDIVGALAAHNLNVPGGKIEAGQDSNNIRFIGEFQSVDDIKGLHITTAEGQNFALRDIADVKDAARDIETGARYDGKPVVILSVVKATDGNAIKIANQLHKQLPALEKDMQTRYPDARMEIISDSSVAVSKETNNTILGIVLGLALTVLTLLFFTRNWRSTVIAGIVIPASLVAGFLFMDAAGFTINAMTLLACSSALGTLISNAIVLIEAALKELDVGKTPEQAAVDGTKKVVVPILAATGTNIVVFLPIAFMGGIAGQFMAQFGLTVVFLTILSLMFSFTLTPMMIAKILRKNKEKRIKNKEKKNDNSLSWFKPIYDWQLKKPWQAVGIAAAVLVLSLIPMRWVGNEFRPDIDASQITVTARAPAGSSYAKAEKIALQIEEKLREFTEVKSTSVKIGERGVQNVTVKVELVPYGKRKLSDKRLAQVMLPALSQIPDAEIQIRAGEAMGGDYSSDMILDINGEDDTKREAYADQVIELLNRIPEIQSAVRAQQAPGMEITFVPDADAMSFWGIKNAYAGTALRTALFGNDSYKYKEAGKEYPIVLEFAKPFKNREMFDSVFVASQKGLVPMSELGEIKFAQATPDIRRLDKNRITEININLGKSTIGPVQSRIESALKTIDWAPGYYAQFGGMSEIQSETTGEIGQAFLLATILTFMLLAAMMNTWVHPFTIATGILTSFSGVFILMFLSGATINVAAMLAIVMLVGLVVNNNILLLEPTIARINQGESRTSALWAEFNDKKRMILMATIAVAAGMVPQLWSVDGMKSSMAAVICGGILASLFWTFMVTPAIFTLMERVRNRNK